MLKPGTHLGPYEILSLIGAGGMGEVYKARDPRLERIVAIKVLPAHLADRPELRERFEREARTVAGLQHPNICVLHDIGRQDGTDFLVMEYLEGETLAQRLQSPDRKGGVAVGLPLDQVLKYAVEISDALDKAHRNGVTHRDIKPGNIMITKGGSKILDFGLAKLKQEAAPAELSPSQIPTAGASLTQHGALLGTMQYMAPEQVEGDVEAVDARTDIFAFGATVYEMATGKKAFAGKSQASLIAAIMSSDPPPMSTLQPMAPPALDRLVKQCLAKEPDERWQTAADLCRELKWIAQSGGQAGMPAPLRAPAAARWRRALPASVAAAIALALGIAIGARIPKPPIEAAPSPAHLVIPLPPGDRFPSTIGYLPVAFSPDGHTLVYSASHNGTRQLFLRGMDSQGAEPIPGTEGGETPFFSPDGQWIGFFAGAKLKKVPLAGGPPLTICDSGANNGAAWGPDGTIVFSPGSSSGLVRVSAAGGKPEPLTTLDRAQGEVGHRWPQFLPGGKAVLFSIRAGRGWDENHVAVARLDTGERHIVIRGGHTGRYVPTGPSAGLRTGHIVYYRAGSLLAVPFDLARLEVTSNAPITIAEGIAASDGSPGAAYSFSDTGTLAYVPASLHQFERRLVWVDRKGQVQPLPAPPRYYEGDQLSPDGQRAALNNLSDTEEAWIYDLARGTMTRLNSEGDSQDPIWSPDGTWIAYTGWRAGFRNVYRRPADGTGKEERLTTGGNFQQAYSWSPDGKWIAFHEVSSITGDDIMMVSVEDDHQVKPFLQTKFSEDNPFFSPDGRWLAYKSNESGRLEVYVQPFPGPGGKWQISDGGADNVIGWTRSGRELFYTNGNKLLAVDVNPSRDRNGAPGFSAGRPHVLFDGVGWAGGIGVAPDGQRFLMSQPVEPEQPATQINVVLNWFEELRRKAPAAR
jgi:serine/threonine-protein kinase